MRRCKTNIKYILILLLVAIIILMAVNSAVIVNAYKRHSMSEKEYLNAVFSKYLEEKSEKWSYYYDNGSLVDEVKPAGHIEVTFSCDDSFKQNIDGNLPDFLSDYVGDYSVAGTISPARDSVDLCLDTLLENNETYTVQAKCELKNKSVTARVDELSDMYFRADYGLYSFYIGDESTVDKMYDSKISEIFADGKSVAAFLCKMGQTMLDNTSDVKCENTVYDDTGKSTKCYKYTAAFDLNDIDIFKHYLGEDSNSNQGILEVYVDYHGHVITYNISVDAEIVVDENHIGQCNIRLMPTEIIGEISADRSETIIISDEKSLIRYVESIKKSELKNRILGIIN